MQVSKRKETSSHIEPVFKTIKSQAELKRLIDKYIKEKEEDIKNKLIGELKEAEEDIKRDKIRKKEERIELNKARETLEREAFDVAGYDKQYFDELYKIATKHPKEFNEIIQKSKIDGLVREFDEYKQDKKIGEVVKSTPVGAMEQAIHDVNTKQKLEIGSIIDSELHRLDTISKRMGVPEKVAQIPLLRVLIDKIESDSPGISPYAISRFLKDRYGIKHAFELRDDNLTKIRALYFSKAVPPAAAAHPPPTEVKTGKSKKGKGLSGYIGGTIIKDVLKRFKILVGEAASGNSSPEIKAEIYDIIDFLYKNKKIKKPEHNKIVRAFQLDKP